MTKKGERKLAPTRSSGEVLCHLASSWPRPEGMNVPRGSREPPHGSRDSSCVSFSVPGRRKTRLGVPSLILLANIHLER